MPHVYCINLDRSTDRWQWMERQFRRLSMEYTRIPAVDGQSLSEERLASLVDRRHPDFRDHLMTTNAVGCALSHIHAYDAFLASDSRLCLVCEDDVTFNNDIVEVLRDVERAWSDGDVVLLFFCGDEKPFSTIGGIGIGNKRTVNPAVDPGLPYTAASYVIDRIAASAIRDLNRRITYSADSWGHFWTNGAVASLKAVLPPVTRPAHFASDIGYSFVGKLARAVERIAGRPMFGELRSMLGRGIAMRYRLVDQPVRIKKGPR